MAEKGKIICFILKIDVCERFRLNYSLSIIVEYLKMNHKGIRFKSFTMIFIQFKMSICTEKWKMLANFCNRISCGGFTLKRMKYVFLCLGKSWINKPKMLMLFFFQGRTEIQTKQQRNQSELLVLSGHWPAEGRRWGRWGRPFFFLPVDSFWICSMIFFFCSLVHSFGFPIKAHARWNHRNIFFRPSGVGGQPVAGLGGRGADGSFFFGRTWWPTVTFLFFFFTEFALIGSFYRGLLSWNWAGVGWYFYQVFTYFFVRLISWAGAYCF